MSAFAVLFAQSKPPAPKIPSRGSPPTGLDTPGMWSVVAGSKGTTLNRVRSNVDGNAGLILVPPPVPVVGAMPLIWRGVMVPCTSHQNCTLSGVFLQTTPLALAVQAVLRHLAAWNFWAMKSPTE